MSKNKQRPAADHKSPEPHFVASDPYKLALDFLRRQGRDNHGHLALRYWRDEFWRFVDGRYRKISHAELKAKLTEHIRQTFHSERRTNHREEILTVTTGIVSNTMQALMGKVLIDSETEQPAWLGNGKDGPLFVFKNGLVHAEALSSPCIVGARPHCAKWFTQTAFPYDYDPHATCPGWLTFLDEVLEGDSERICLLQQWFGYCLTNDTTQQRFVVAVGEGQNGKSVVLDVLTALLGPENVSHVPAEVFGQRFQLTMTLGKLANISYDTGAIQESAEATIKEFTAGDRMYFDRKGVPGLMAYPTARLILATNQDPRFADRSRGIWRRMIVIPFRVNVPVERQDPQLAAKLKEELPGIFNWAVRGLRDLRATGRFIVPTVCQTALEDLKRESNPAGEFLRENYATTDGAEMVPCQSIYEHYRSWCGNRQLKALDATNFGKELRKLFPDVKRERHSVGARGYSYRGLRPVLPEGGTEHFA